MRFERKTWHQIPVEDRGPIARMGLLGRALSVFLAKHCERDGAIPLRAGPLEDALGARIGATPYDRRVLQRLLPDLVSAGVLACEGDNLVHTQFALWQSRTREPWRRLYVREEGPFASLPVATRAVAAYLACKAADDEGMLRGLRRPEEVSVYLLRRGGGGSRQDQRLTLAAVTGLRDEGFLVADDRGMRVKNFAAAQLVRVTVATLPSTDPRAPTTIGSLADAARTDPELAPSSPRARPESTLSSPPTRPQLAPNSPPVRPELTLSSPRVDPELATSGVASDGNQSLRAPASSSLIYPPSSPSGGVPTAAPSEPTVGLAAPLPGAATPPTKADGEFRLEVQDAPAPKGKGRKVVVARPDPPPPTDHRAHLAWTVLVGDEGLRRIVRGPGDYLMRKAAEYADFSADELATVIHQAAEYLSRGEQTYSETHGRNFLNNQFLRFAKRRSAVPPLYAPGVGAAKVSMLPPGAMAAEPTVRPAIAMGRNPLRR